MNYRFANLYDLFDFGRKSKRDGLLGMIPLGKRKKALSIGCGTGICALHLNKLGYFTTGIDLSEAMIEVAKAKSDQIKWLIGDASTYNYEDIFDLVVLSTNVINHFIELEDLKALFENIFKHLVYGGTIIFDAPNEETLKNCQNYANYDLGKSLVYVYSTYDDENRKFTQITQNKDYGKDVVELKYWEIEDIYSLTKEFKPQYIEFKQVPGGLVWKIKK